MIACLCICFCTTYMPHDFTGWKRVPDSLELTLQIGVRLLVGTGSQTWVLWKSISALIS